MSRINERIDLDYLYDDDGNDDDDDDNIKDVFIAMPLIIHNVHLMPMKKKISIR